MTPDDYLLAVISKYKLATGKDTPAFSTAQRLYPILKHWAGQYLLQVLFSGSYAKGTGIRGSADLDLFVSLDPSTPHPLKYIYDSLYSDMRNSGYSTRAQNVSVSIQYSGQAVDLIPARKQSGNTNDHSLFKNRSQTWTQTNVEAHIELIRGSGRLDEIRAIKIWRNLNNLEFPSFLLELAVLEALHGQSKNQLATNVITIFHYLADLFSESRLVDPANSNNVVSDDLTSAEKSVVATAASTALGESTWDQIIW